MAALEKTGSRAGSLSLENENISSQTHLLHHHQNGEVDHTNSLANLARRSTMRKRSFRWDTHTKFSCFLHSETHINHSFNSFFSYFIFLILFHFLSSFSYYRNNKKVMSLKFVCSYSIDGLKLKDFSFLWKLVFINYVYDDVQ